MSNEENHPYGRELPVDSAYQLVDEHALAV